MKCDLCPQPIILNQQHFVIEEDPMPYRDHTLVTFAAHRECYDRQQGSPPYIYTEQTAGDFLNHIFRRH